MSDKLEHRMRAGRSRLPQPDHDVTERARQAVLAAAGRHQQIVASGRLRRRRLVAGVAAAGLAVAAAFGAGFAFASSRGQPERIRTVAQTAEGPGFLPAAGWNVLQTGTTVPPQAPVATAANVPLDPADSAQGFPFHTIAKLPENGVVLTALFMSPVSENDIAGFAHRFRPATLPLDLANAEQSGPIEGQSLDQPGPRVLFAGVDGYAIQVDVFFGSKSPPDAVVAAADEELARLVVPVCPASAQPIRASEFSSAAASAEAFVHDWLTSHYDPRRPQDLVGARLRTWLAPVAPHRRLIENACPSPRWRKTVEVDVTLAPAARANTGPAPLMFFLAKTPEGWKIWH